MRYIFDIECDSLNATKIHCLSYSTEEENEQHVLYEIDDIKTLLAGSEVLIGHNVVKYDIPQLERLLGIKIHARLIDTLGLSYILEPARKKHGLESYGEDFGVPKPKIDDWENLTREEYGHRCSTDVKINRILWNKQNRYLKALYEDEEKKDNFIDYISFKMDCLREQEETGFVLDIDRATTKLAEWENEAAEKRQQLEAAMPKIPIKTTKSCPKILYKANGELSARGTEWFKLLETKQLPPHTPEVEVITGYEDPNSNSHDQIKNWLYSLGWVPDHIKHVRDKKTNTVKKVPQIAAPEGGGELSESVKALYEKEPALEVLEGLSILSHRISILKGFLRDQQEGRIYSKAKGLTNTMRLQHTVIVNLPAVEKKYGKDIRGCLIADDNSVLCGSDLSGIEDSTKRHYIYDYDPAYVEEMNRPDFDPHLDIAMLSKLLTAEQVQAHKEDKENYSVIRKKAKIVNFSATYKVGADTLARNSGFTTAEAKRILRIYWERNHSILKVEQSLEVKDVYGQKWLRNPVSGFWYSLRAEKDRFSTLNQGTAVYVFDVWVMNLRNLGIRIGLQYHDEVLFNVKKGMEDYTKNLISKAMEKVNERLKLNITVGCSVQFGQTYADCH